MPPDGGGPDAHGTAVCSLIFGRSNAVRGLAPGCLGLALPIFFRKGTDPETRPVSQLDLARAISFGLERGVSIINISAGQKSATVEPNSISSRRCRRRLSAASSSSPPPAMMVALAYIYPLR